MKYHLDKHMELKAVCDFGIKAVYYWMHFQLLYLVIFAFEHKIIGVTTKNIYVDWEGFINIRMCHKEIIL